MGQDQGKPLKRMASSDIDEKYDIIIRLDDIEEVIPSECRKTDEKEKKDKDEEPIQAVINPVRKVDPKAAKKGFASSKSSKAAESPTSSPSSQRSNSNTNLKSNSPSSSSSNLKTPGWKLYIPPDLAANSKPQALAFKGFVVAVIGLYDRGKTFLINNLCVLTSGKDLPSGKIYRTQGLSFKYFPPEGEGKEIVMLDSAGLNAPIKMGAGTKKELMKKRLTEFFVNDLIFEIADLFVVVVNDLTVPDQEFIWHLQKKLKKCTNPEKQKKVIIVHNFKDIKDEAQALYVWKDQVCKSYPKGEQQTEKFTINMKSEKGGILPDKKAVNILTLGTRKSRHIYLMNNESSFGKSYNHAAFQLIRQWIYNDFPYERKPFFPVKMIQDKAQELLKNYVTNIGEFVFNENSSEFIARPLSSEAPMELKSLSIDLSTGSLTSLTDNGVDLKIDIWEITAKNNKDRRLEIFIDCAGMKDGEISIEKLTKSRELKFMGEKKDPEFPPGDRGEKKASNRSKGKILHVLKIPDGFDVEKARRESQRPGEIRIIVPEHVSGEFL